VGIDVRLDRLVRCAEELGQQPLPSFLEGVSAGFPSPAEAYQEERIDLNEVVIKHPSSTYFARASGHSMRGCGIYDGDLLVIDRSVEAKSGFVIVAAMNGELLCKVLDTDNRCLKAANPRYPDIPINEEMDFLIEGVVTHSLRCHTGT